MKGLYFLYTFFILTVCSCKSIYIEPPTKSLRQEILPLASKSYISVPFSLDLTPYLTKAEQSIPTIYKGEKQQCEGLSVSYGFNRSPMKFNGAGNKIHCAIEGGLWLKANYCPKCQYLFDNDGNCIVPRVHVSCGVKEPLRRFNLEYSSTLSIGNAYNIISKTQFNAFKLIDPCNITFVGYDITQTVEKEVRKELVKLEGTIDENIQKVALKPLLMDAWMALQNPISIQDFGFLNLYPSELSIHNLLFNGNSLNGVTTIAIRPIVSSEKTELKIQPLPPISEIQTAEHFSLEIPVHISYDSLSSFMNQFLKGQEIVIKKRKIMVERVGVYGTKNHQLIIELKFNGFRHGTLYLLGTPSLNKDKKELSLDSLDFDLETKGGLLNTARWIFDSRITKMIQEKAHFSYAQLLNTTLKNIEHAMNTKLNESISLQGKVSKTQINMIQLNERHISIFLALEGNLKLKIK